MLRKLGIFIFIVFVVGIAVSPVEARPALDITAYPVVPIISGNVYYRARALFRIGVRYDGNRADVFAKIGDSITAFPQFLIPVGNGGLHLGSYTNLARAAQFFTRENARTANSFANVSLGAYPGWKTADLLNPAKNITNNCKDMTPVDCELSIVKPSIALIMIGTNDLPIIDVATYRANLNRIVTIVEKHGVIPVLSTLPRRMGDPNSVSKLDSFNQVILAVAAAHNAPVWNYWLAVETLPNHGISTDLVHPSDPPDHNDAVFDAGHLQYGWNMRNLTALQTLNSLLVVVNP